MPATFTSKFTRLLQTFDPSTLKAFEVWLQSPWCNSNKNLPRLLEQLMRFYPDFDDLKLTKERLFQKILPSGKYSESRMNNLLSEAYQAAEKFVVFQRFSREEVMQQALLAREFQERGLDDWFSRTAELEIERLEKKEVKDWEEHLSLFQWHRRVYDHSSQAARAASGQDTVEQMDRALDRLYLLEKAAIINEMQFRNKLFHGEHKDVTDAAEHWRRGSAGLQHPALALYRMRFAPGKKKDMLQHYRSLHSAFLENFGQLNPRDQKIHLLSLLNDTMLLIKSGDLDITECLELYKLGLEAGAVAGHGNITGNTFINIVTASNTKGSFDFTQEFLATYSKCLNDKIREDVVQWAMAHTAYWQGDLEASLDVLSKYDFQTHNLQLIGRVLTTQVYFDLHLEQDAYQTYLFNYLDTFEKWLSREKIWSKGNTVAFLRFVQKCRALAKYHAGADPQPQKLEKLFAKERNIQALNWLKQRKEAVLTLKKSHLRGR